MRRESSSVKRVFEGDRQEEFYRKSETAFKRRALAAVRSIATGSRASVSMIIASRGPANCKSGGNRFSDPSSVKPEMVENVEICSCAVGLESTKENERPCPHFAILSCKICSNS